MRQRYAKVRQVRASLVIYLPEIRTLASKAALNDLWTRQDRVCVAVICQGCDMKATEATEGRLQPR